MFVDKAEIKIKAGKGGNGAVSFRREKYVPEGGPDGGDGGRGGDVVFEVDPGLRTLMDFRYRRHFKASNGQHGRGKNQHGRHGEDVVIRVPPGTVIKDGETGGVIADLVEPGQRVIAARGGRGGRGNTRFATPTRRAPRFAEKGEPGEERVIDLELRLLADVGLVGFPNAGKSTLLARISAARPKAAPYPFTTLAPNLGVVEVNEGDHYVVADLPGLIEGAHRGVGLGHEFLRHVERTRVLVCVIDAAGTEGRDPLRDTEILAQELAAYRDNLPDKVRVIAANKMDLVAGEGVIERLRAQYSPKGIEVFPISAVTGGGVPALVRRLAAILKEEEKKGLPETLVEPVEKIFIAGTGREGFSVSVEGGRYVVRGKKVERLVAMTDFDNEEAAARFAQLVKKMGVEKAVRRAGAVDGDTVVIGEMEFELGQ